MELSVDGRKVYAASGGRAFDPALPTVIFVHGAAMDHTAWMLQSRYFAHHGHNVLALDLPGCGRSDGPMPETIEAFADWLLRLLDAAELERATLVGHSMGALISLAAAAAAPDRIEKLVLMGVAVPMPVNDAFLDAARRNDHLAIELMNDWAHGRAAHIGGCKIPGIWMIGGDMRLVERAKPGVLHDCLKLCDDYGAGQEAAAKIRCPVLIVAGDRDMMTPAKSAKALAKQIETADVSVIANCGHIMMIEQPDAVLDALKSAI